MKARRIAITVNPGVASLIKSAELVDGEVTHPLSGDLCQMAEQERHLRKHGIQMGRSGGIPGCYGSTNYNAALKILWDDKVSGWWNYRDELFRHGLCSKAEFDAELAQEVAKSK